MKEIFYDWGGVNVWLFHAINNFRSGWLDNLMLLGTTLGEHTLFTPYLSVLLLLALVTLSKPDADPRHYQFQVTRWISVIAVFSIGYLCDGLLLGYLKPMLDFPRPPLALLPATLHVVGTPEYHHSLPSGHSSFAMLVTASLWPMLSRKWRIAGVCFVLWVGISRISLGAHFPADVLAGFLTSLAVVLLVYAAVQKLIQLAANQPRHES